MDKSNATSSKPNDFTNIIVAVLVILLTIVLFFIYKRTKQTRRGVLITGLCNSGKTLLYSRLIHNKFVNTQTSIKENIGEYTAVGGLLRVIDIPGHERLRDKFFEDYKAITRGIVYVVDSQNIQKDIRDVAEFLYNILTDDVISANKPAILILCNKQDQPLVKNRNAIKTLLEKELSTLRLTKGNQLESVDSKGKKAAILGDPLLLFSFDSLPTFDVDIGESYATDNENKCNIKELEHWLAKIS